MPQQLVTDAMFALVHFEGYNIKPNDQKVRRSVKIQPVFDTDAQTTMSNLLPLLDALQAASDAKVFGSFTIPFYDPLTIAATPTAESDVTRTAKIKFQLATSPPDQLQEWATLRIPAIKQSIRLSASPFNKDYNRGDIANALMIAVRDETAANVLFSHGQEPVAMSDIFIDD